MIALPIFGILGVGGYMMTHKDEKPADIIVDENDSMKRLIRAIDKLESQGRKVIKLQRARDSKAKLMGKAFQKKADKWLDEWEAVTAGLRDDEGRFLEEYSGYKGYRKRINTLLYDVNKDSGFF